MTRKKIFLAVFAVIFTIFAIINILWFLNYNHYEKLISNDYRELDNVYSRENENHYVFTVAKPFYLQYEGNVAITNEEDTLSILIWPKKFKNGDYEIGLQLAGGKEKSGYMFLVDKSLDYLDDTSNNFSEAARMEILGLLEQNKEELGYIYKLAKDEWSFL